MDVIEAIKTRRTIGRTKPGQEPPRELIEKLLQSAIEAPNHYLTEPWRFFVLTGTAREAFGEAHAEGLRRRSADVEPARLEMLMNAEHNKFLRAPALIVVGVKQTGAEDWQRREDIQASSAAIQNMLLTATSIGLAAAWRTGMGAYDPYVLEHLGLEASDSIAGIVYVGYPDEEYVASLKPRIRSFATITQWIDS